MDEAATNMKFGVMDFLNVLGILMKEDSSITNPYFFMTSWSR